MDTYLFSIHPKWCEKIFSGEKTIEVRKTAPKPPFKVVVYCTKGKPNLYIPQEHNCFPMDEASQPYFAEEPILQECDNLANSKVIGEFIVNEVEKLYCRPVPYLNKNNLGYEHFIDNGVYRLNADDGIIFERGDCYIDTMIKNEDLSKMCLSANELFSYCRGFGNHIYTLHITATKLYDKPKELWEFRKPYGNCIVKCAGAHYDRCPWRTITRPPQSYMRIEEVEE